MNKLIYSPYIYKLLCKSDCSLSGTERTFHSTNISLKKRNSSSPPLLTHTLLGLGWNESHPQCRKKIYSRMDTGRGSLTQMLEEEQGRQKHNEVELLRVPNQGCSWVQLMRSMKSLSSGVWLKSSSDRSEGRVNSLFFKLPHLKFQGTCGATFLAEETRSIVCSKIISSYSWQNHPLIFNPITLQSCKLKFSLLGVCLKLHTAGKCCFLEKRLKTWQIKTFDILLVFLWKCKASGHTTCGRDKNAVEGG